MSLFDPTSFIVVVVVVVAVSPFLRRSRCLGRLRVFVLPSQLIGTWEIDPAGHLSGYTEGCRSFDSTSLILAVLL